MEGLSGDVQLSVVSPQLPEYSEGSACRTLRLRFAFLTLSETASA